MARYFDVHPRNPQPRLIAQAVAMLHDDALIAYPTDSCYALASSWTAAPVPTVFAGSASWMSTITSPWCARSSPSSASSCS